MAGEEVADLGSALAALSSKLDGTIDTGGYQEEWLDPLSDKLDEGFIAIPSSGTGEELLKQKQTIELLKSKLDDLFRTILLTGQVWARLLDLLLLKLEASHHTTTASQASALATGVGSWLTVDTTLLILGIQEKMVEVSVALCQLTTTSILQKSLTWNGSVRRNIRWTETVKILLQPQYLSPSILEMVIPSAVEVRRFTVDTLHSIGK